jgi:hypothetical protein
LPKDPPVGRIGYVISGFGDGRTISAPREVRCNGCRTWFDGKFVACPDCGHARPGFNKRLRSAQLDNHLLGYAHDAGRQPQFAPGITSDVNLPAAA